MFFTVKKTSRPSIKYLTIQHPGLSLQEMDDSIQPSHEPTASRHTVMLNNSVSKLSRSYSDSYLLNGSDTGFTALAVDSNGEDLFHSQIYPSSSVGALKFSYSFPIIPQINDNSLPSADVLPPQVPCSDTSSYSSDDGYSQKQYLLPEDPEIDYNNKYLALKRRKKLPLLKILDADYFTDTSTLSSLYADISDESKQVESVACVDEESSSHNQVPSLQPIDKRNKRLLTSEVSSSDSSVALNKETHSFIASSLNTNGEGKYEKSLGKIIARYHQRKQKSLSQDSSVCVLNKTTDHSTSNTPITTVFSTKEQEILNDNDDQAVED